MFSDAVVDYILKEAETGIRIMARDQAASHVFDIGKGSDGEEYSFVMTILPKRALEVMQFRASRALEEKKIVTKK